MSEDDDLPQSPLTAMAAAVTEMHEIMQMLCAMLSAMVSGEDAP